MSVIVENRSMKRPLVGLLLTITMLLASISPSNAVEYVRVSGIVVNDSGLPISSLKIGFWSNENLSGAPISLSEVKNGNYSAVVPKSESLGIALMFTSGDFFAGWSAARLFEGDSSFDLYIPPPFQIVGNVTDAKGESLGKVNVRLDDSNEPFDSHAISKDNLNWRGYLQSHIATSDERGNFRVYSYSTNQVKNSKKLGVVSPTNAFTYWESSGFLVSSDISLTICIPINFGASLTLEKNCMEDKTAYELRIRKEKTELAKKDFILVMGDYQKLMNRITNLQTKYPFEKTLSDTKAKLSKVTLVEGADFTYTRVYFKNLNAQLDKSEILWTKTQKTSISCVKGKLIKKVTGIKPKCPTGYMKK